MNESIIRVAVAGAGGRMGKEVVKLVLNEPDFELDYPPGYLRRKVSSLGRIKIGGRSIMLTTALRRWNVGLQPLSPSLFDVWIASLRIGTLNLLDEKFTVSRPDGSEQRL